MNRDFYLVIRSTEDGTYINEYTKEQLGKELRDPEFLGRHKILSELPKMSDNYFDTQGVTILHVNRVVVPKEVKHVTEYSID